MKKYFVISSTEGCASNLAENVSYRQFFTDNDGTLCSTADEAETIIINTCAYNKQMEDKSVDLISKFQNQFPGKSIIVTGCFPKINPSRSKPLLREEELSPLDFKSLSTRLKITPLKTFDALSANFFDESDFTTLSSQHKILFKLRQIILPLEKKLNCHFIPLHNILETAVVNSDYHVISIGRGCKGTCTFCGIKNVKGEIQSRPLEVILSEFNSAYANGKRHFWLIGDDVASWGADKQMHIYDLLTKVLSIQSDIKIVINSFHPQFFFNAPSPLINILSSPQIIGINIPIQSASKKVLQTMGRYYCPNAVLNIVKSLKTNSPSLAIKTNLIIAFPSEGWSDFLSTLKAVYNFDAILAQPFAPRPNTKASQLPLLSQRTVQIRMLLISLAIFLRHSFVFIKSFIRTKRHE